MTTPYDVAIVGGGAVGAATAMALLAERPLSLVLLEAEDRLAAHQTGHNSGVIHAGLYYKPGSLKAATATAGREALYRFCAEEGVPHRRTGKLVLATRPEELPRLDELERRGKANGLVGLQRLGPAEIAGVEPHAAGVGGLWVEETGIVDFPAVTAAYARRVRQQGGEIRLGCRFLAARERGGVVELETSSGPLAARVLIGCAGLAADRVARRSGLAPGVAIVPFRGDYYELVPERRSLVQGLIYPVPDPAFPFLGVHFTRTLHGGVEAGPNAVLALARERYRRLAFVPEDAWEALTYPGTWRLMARHWQTGAAELRRAASRASFAQALARLVPAVTAADLVPAGCGIRAQAVDRQGRLVEDFLFVETARTLHVLNAPSPAATASMAIGRAVAVRAVEKLGR